MKKLAALTIMLALSSFAGAFAQEENLNLVPDTTLEEMIENGVEDEAISTDSLDLINRHQVVCFARNRQGRRFAARGYYARLVQEQALRQCRSVSRMCFALGCRR